MGMFDYIHAICPECLDTLEFQSKAGVCKLKNYSIESVPPEIARDLQEETEYCSNCKTSLRLITISPIPRVQMKLILADRGTDYEQ